jgi:aspartate-semialdehyde dehydrogenase
VRATFDVAVVGATGLVGEAMLGILEQRRFPIGRLYALASSRSAGRRIRVNGTELTVGDLAEFDFSRVQLALFSAGGAVSGECAPRAAAAGCVVIDNTSRFRNDPDIPLVVPEVNAAQIAGVRARGIIANPNCSTVQLVVVLKPIYDRVGIERVNVATYQSVSGAGRRALETLKAQTAALLAGETLASDGARPFAANVVPHVDVFEDNGYTREEMKIVRETRKIMVTRTCALMRPRRACPCGSVTARRCTSRRAIASRHGRRASCSRPPPAYGSWTTCRCRTRQR